MAEAPMVLILAGLAAYTVLGGADFGAGLWELTARGERGATVREHTHRAMAPVWEANHVWLVFVLVVCWTAYPHAFASITSTLSVPLFAAAVGIILRGASYALRAGTERPREEGALSLLFALSSIITPFALGTVVGAVASGRVPVGNAAGDQWTSWTGSTSLLVGSLAVVAGGYLAAVYLAADAVRAGDQDLARRFRARALGAGVLAGALAAVGVLVLRSDARHVFDGLTSGGGLVALVVSVLAGVVALALVVGRRYEPARVAAAVATVAIVAGWGLAQQPTFLPGLTVEEAAAGHATLVAVLASVGVGLVVLVPSLALLFGLLLGGRFDAGGGTLEELVPEVAPGRALPPMLAAGGLALGAALTFFFEGAVRGVGIALMLGFAALAFTLLAPEP